MERPSVAAIVAPWDLSLARERVATAMRALGMKAFAQPLPRGYRPAPGEYIGLTYKNLPGFQVGRHSHPNVALVSTDVARIFHLAMSLSQSHPDEVLAAWRRFSGFEPVAKVLWGGKPRWRDGEDHDHEIGYVLPRTQPAELKVPGELRVPVTASSLTAILDAVVAPLSDPLAEGGESWLSRRSPLA